MTKKKIIHLMKITIGGSMTFAKEQVKIKKQLEKMGHTVLATDDIEDYVDNPAIKKSFEDELKISIEYDIMRKFFKKIETSDALLICNFPKNGIDGYLGTSVLMEIGLAYHLGKNIFLLYGVDKTQSYALEIAIIKPTILNGDVLKVMWE